MATPLMAAALSGVGESGLIILSDPGRCGSCGVMRCFFINRDGKTQCICCDRARQPVANS